MPRLVPVVEIDNRKRVSVPPQSNGIRRDQQSSSPIFISSNNVATSSNSKINGLSGSSSNSGSLRAPIVEIKANTSRVVSVNKGLTNGVTSAKLITSRSKDKTENELVLPPAGEPRLKSVFDTSWAGSCVWSPSHRVARDTALVTCQWIVNDEGFGEVEKCEKVFSTVESLTKHVHYAHCEPSRPVVSYSNAHVLSGQPLLACAWDTCKYKRFKPALLREHVLEHLRPAAFSCPFQICRRSINSTIESADALDSHIQTYHQNGELLRPLGIPKPIKLLLTPDLPPLAAPFPQWMINNPRLPIVPRPIGIPREPRKRAPSTSPGPAPGEVRPWDQLWLEMNKLEPPAITIDAEPCDHCAAKDLPMIPIATIPTAVPLSLEPKKRSHVELEVTIDAPPASSGSKMYIDLTGDDVEVYPPAPEPKYGPVVDMTAVSLAKRDAKREHHRRRYRLGLASTSASRSPAEHATSSSGGEEASIDPNALEERMHKRLKVEE